MIGKIKNGVAVFIVLMGVITLITCAITRKRPPVEVNGEWCGKTDGLFRHRWWNFYESGISFSDCGLYKNAELDLLEAIDANPVEDRRARTYGMHFLKYLPHRELGIVYFHQGRIEKAIKELEISLKDYGMKTSKAMDYLNRARAIRLLLNSRDKEPPRIHTSALMILMKNKDLTTSEIKVLDLPEIKKYGVRKRPGKDEIDLSRRFYTNEPSVVIQGVVTDDHFVRKIEIHEKRLLFDLSEKSMDFHHNISLNPGVNTIRISAWDLLGKRSKSVTFEICLDQTAPVIDIEKMPKGFGMFADSPDLLGNISDDHGLFNVIVNGKKEPIGKPGKPPETDFRLERNVSLDPNETRLTINVVDLAGNETTVTIEPPDRHILKRPGVPDETKPEILLENLVEGENRAWSDMVVIEGVVQDNYMVKKLFINGERILKIRCRKFHFARDVKLEQGENWVVLEAHDVLGNVETREIKIVRETPPPHDIGSRMTAWVSEFSINKEEPSDEDREFINWIEDLVKAEIRDRRRFFLLEQDEYGINFQVEGEFGGMVTKRKRSIEIDLWLKDNESEGYLPVADKKIEEYLAVVDIYAEGEDVNDLEALIRRLAIKLEAEFPVLDAEIVEVHVNENEISFNIGSGTKLKNGMKLILYRLLETSGSSPAGFEILGEARVESIKEDMSTAELIGGKGKNDIKIGHRIITK